MGWRTWGTVFVGLAAFTLAGCKADKVKSLDNEGNGANVWSPPSNQTPNVTVRPPWEKEASCPAYCSPDPGTPIVRVPSANPIPAENSKPGDPTWHDGTTAWNHEVEIYGDSESLQAGEALNLKVSTSAASTVTADVYRIGWYQGAGARKVWTAGPFATTHQSACDFDPSTALVECDWKDTFSVRIDAAWPSGYYVVKVRRADGFKRFYPFVVRDRRAAEVLYTPNFTTYQAYNTWGGESLYFDGAGVMPTGKGFQVSFNRPYELTDGGGKTFNLDTWFVQFLEKNGYDVTYSTQLDFVRFSNLLDGIGAFVDAGQDEYWPIEERDQVDAALQTGKMSLAYFGGNGGYWRIRLLTDAHGKPLRTIVCYKDNPDKDPHPDSTLRFRDPPDARPEQNLWGTMYEGWQLIPFPLIVSDPSSWIFNGTGLAQGTMLQGLVGFEYDRAFPDWAGYPGGVQVPLTSPVVSGEGIPSYSQAAVRTLGNGRLVFAAGTIWWPLALGPDPELYDARVERVTLNVIERALAHRRPERQFPPVQGPHPVEPAPDPVWAKTVVPFVGVSGQSGDDDGPAASAKFNVPTGLATLPAGELVVADTGNNKVRLVGIDPARTVITLAGNGELGFRDGDGAQAMFRRPTDVAVGPSGEIYVADSDNHAIRRLDKTASGWTVTTLAGQGFSAGYADGGPGSSRFNRPTSIAVDAAGNVYVADQANNLIRMIKAGTFETVTLAGHGVGSDDASVGTQASFNSPAAIAVGKSGELFVMDSGNQLLRRIQLSGTHAVDTVAGNRNAWFGFADGAGNVARFRAQMGLDVGPTGEVMVADTANYRVRKVIVGAGAAQSQVFTVAGSGQFGTDLGSGATADIVTPSGLTYGPNEKIYVSDPFHQVILEITR